ncbi:MAG: YesU family protein [Treponema sp.]|nr:YesU family protein [Treponema sp.]
MEQQLIYDNPLSCAEDVAGFVMEGTVNVSFPDGKMRLESVLDPALGQKANYVFWCPVEFPSDVRIEWDFQPLQEPGLAMLFFAAAGKDGTDMFSPSLEKRTGEYQQYHHGDIHAFHVSYFRRMWEEERSFHTCNLRKSYGFHLVAQGADPMPDTDEIKGPYHLCVCKKAEVVTFSINGLELFSFKDDGSTFGPLLKGGRIGFRQMAPLVGEYSNLKVYAL